MLNNVELIGRLGADPEEHSSKFGDFVTLSLATSESWKDKNSGERKEKTEWHRITIYNEGLARVASQYARKGQLIYVQGQLETTKYEKNGEDRYSTQVVVKPFNGKFIMLDRAKSDDDSDERPKTKPRGDGNSFTGPKNKASGRPGSGRAGQTSFDDDGIPF